MVPEQALGQFLAAVHGDLPGAVAEGGVLEALQQGVAIGLELVARAVEGRDDLARHHVGDELAEGGVRHGARYRFMPGEIAEIGKGRVRPVEHAQFHQLEGLDIFDQLRAGLFEGWAALGEIVLDHPLDEGFGHQRPGIFGAEPAGDELAVIVGGGGHDAVDHGGGEGDFFSHVAAEFCVTQLGKAGDDAGGGLAVGREIVAAHHGEGRNAGGAAAGQRLHDEAGGGNRVLRVLEIVDDVGVLLVELSGCGIVAIALFGDGQRDDADFGARHQVDEAVALLIGVDDFDHRTDDAQFCLPGIADCDGEESVLRSERLLCVGPAEAGADNAPAGVFGQQIVDIDRHMGAVEGADPQMHNAGGDGVAVIGGFLNGVREVGQQGVRETLCHCGDEPGLKISGQTISKRKAGCYHRGRRKMREARRWGDGSSALANA